jgi:hypothetical protein
MLNTKLNEKSALARLLATENLSVQYSAKYPTAFFDLQSRTIHIPLIPNLDEDILDLFEGHEVGHARETPAEGFHSAINDNGEINDTLKTYLNVVEDIRIERKIKNEYPGLRRSFANAYKKLVSQNFFGEDLQARINSMDFIDKLNVEAKVGAHILVDFDDNEKALLEEAYSLETWDEVVAFAKKLIGEQAKRNKKQEEGAAKPNPQSNPLDGKKSKSPDGKPSDENNSNSSDNESDEEQDSDSSQPSDEDENKSEESEDQDNSDSVAPSQTDKTFREKESQMFADAKKKDSYYSQDGASITIGKYNLNEYILPASKLSPLVDLGARTMFEHYIQNSGSHVSSYLGIPFSSYDQFVNSMLTEFRNANLAYINFLIKEFEMRKNARMLNRGKISKTGKIDVARLHKYRLSDDIFKRVMSFPEGKNHGMIMYMDLSGSMASVISGVFNQVLILSEFCKKVNIPFRVYGFTDSDISMAFAREHIDPQFGHQRSDAKPHTFQMQHNFHLKEYISSELNTRDYKTAFNNILMMKMYFEAYYSVHRRNAPNEAEQARNNQVYYSIDLKKVGEQLSSTPLNEAVVLSQQISNEFVAKYNIENMVNIFLTDGEADGTNAIRYNGERGQYGMRDGYVHRDCKTQSMITHHSGVRYIIKPNECKVGFSTYHLLKMARKITGARYIGYYLADNSSFLYNAASHDVAVDRSLDWKMHHSNLKSKYRKDKFLHSTTYGYNDYFYISSTGTINDDEDDEEWFDTLNKRYNGNVTKNNLSKAFIDKQTKKQLNRILLVHFGKALAEAA